ncbi:hypothetical protein MMC21_007964 [Puttea exsequens]|nr:hypothetical protein [Puttea exsequens]
METLSDGSHSTLIGGLVIGFGGRGWVLLGPPSGWKVLSIWPFSTGKSGGGGGGGGGVDPPGWEPVEPDDQEDPEDQQYTA